MSPARIGVVGLGLIGGSLIQRLARLPDDYQPVGFDVDAETCEAASAAGVDLTSSAAELATSAELVVVALPPAQTADAVVDALQANPNALVTDVASVKAPVLRRVAERAPAELDRYLPSHPLAGAESAGWRFARPDLLARTIWAVCPPHPGAPAGLLCRWARVFESFGARLVVCDAEEHDLAVARTSHAPHLAAEVIAASLGHGPVELTAALSGGAFRDMTRIARSDRALWGEILELNRERVTEVLDDWIAALERLRHASPPAISEAWERGSALVELVEQLRWRAPEWEPRTFDWPAWDELLALGRSGVAVRRLRIDGDRLSADVAV